MEEGKLAINEAGMTTLEAAEKSMTPFVYAVKLDAVMLLKAWLLEIEIFDVKDAGMSTLDAALKSTRPLGYTVMLDAFMLDV